jgi:hypothetical protein
MALVGQPECLDGVGIRYKVKRRCGHSQSLLVYEGGLSVGVFYNIMSKITTKW